MKRPGAHSMGSNTTVRARQMRLAELLSFAAIAIAVAAPIRAFSQEIGVTGFVEVDHASYLDERPDGRVGREQRALLELRGTGRLHERLELAASGRLRGTSAHGGEGRGSLNEAYADLLFPGVDLRLGRQTIVWGRTDVVNPTDYFAPRDFSDPLDTDDERLGVIAARLRASFGEARLEAVLASPGPLSRLPPLDSRWSPELAATMPHPAEPERELTVRYRTIEPPAPALKARNGQFAARLATTLRGWDISVSYFDGWDDLPAVQARIGQLAEEEVRVELHRTRSRRRAIGGDLATALGPYTVRAEGAYIVPDSVGGAKYFQYVVGLERFFGDPLGAGSSVVLAQWIHEIAPGEFRPGPFDLNHVFRQSLMVRAQHNLTSAVQFEADGVYDLRTAGYYFRPGGSYRLWGRLRAAGSVDLLGGGKDAFFGAFSGNRRVRTNLRYTF